MNDTSLRGTIFLSHASADKTFVDQVRRYLDRAVTFYDIDTMMPGVETIASMKKGVSDAAIYVLFHSDLSASAWVDFEKSLAEVQVITNQKTRILVCPINGSSYKTLPTWMQRYMTTNQGFRPSDISRSIHFLYGKYLKETFPEYFFSHPGREDLEREIALSLRRVTATTGQVVNALVLRGVQGMGRTTLASGLVEKAYPGMRDGGPVFDIPANGDAVDWHLRFKADLDGQLSEDDVARQIDVFNQLFPDKQAETLINSLKHWGEINQVVTIRHRWGLRDKGHTLRPWLASLLERLRLEPNIRLILISERQLPNVEVAKYNNVKQFAVEELSDQTIEFILNERINAKYMNVRRLPELSRKIKGHPATANYTALLVNGGRSIESLVLSSEPLAAFQDQILSEIFDSRILSEIQRKILSLLSWFPKLSAQLIAQVFADEAVARLANELDELVEFSLVDQAETGSYKAPAVVASSYRRRRSGTDQDVFNRMSELLINAFGAGDLDFELIDALLVALVETGQEISERLLRTLTPARIEPVIEREYDAGMGATGSEASAHFERCFKLANLAKEMRTSDDSLENILFYGADSSVRLGTLPEEMLLIMRRKGFLTADYIQASFLYHKKRDFVGAASVLSRSLPASGFRVRNVRLLTRIYLRDGKFAYALDALSHVRDDRLRRDTGLIVMKIRALKGTRNKAEADALMASLKDQYDDYGDIALLKGSAALRSGDYKKAIGFAIQAEDAPRSNKAIVSILKCACEVEQGNFDNLGVTCALARSVGRESDAFQLQARAALSSNNWDEAEVYVSHLNRRDWFDLNIEHRVLEAKLRDADVARDPVRRKETEERRDQVLALLANATEGSGFS